MIKTTLLTATLLMLIFNPALSQKTIGGVAVPEAMDLGAEKLLLNGAGIREKLWLDMYVGALYLQAKTNDPAKIIAADAPMAIKMHIVSGMITAEKMEAATREGFAKATGNKTEPLKQRIDEFMDVFREGIAVNDVFNLVYVPGEGVKIYKNKTLKITLAGVDFKQALFSIWLGDLPADEDLKEGMLGLD